MPEYVYHDRKMMKWMPFNALLEQGDYISDLLQGRERQSMPVLSPDQQAELHYQLEMATIFHYEVDITYFEHHHFHHSIGHITHVDVHNKLIFLDEKSISAEQITDIAIL